MQFSILSCQLDNPDTSVAEPADFSPVPVPQIEIFFSVPVPVPSRYFKYS